MKIIKGIIKPIIFVVIFLLIFSHLSELFCRKTLNGAWNHTHKISGFYNEPENEFDIIYFGSSNTYCSFNPLVVYGETGLKSYVFASQQQPVWATYTYIKEALKTQKPQLLVVDVLMFSKNLEYYDDGVNYSFMDDIPFSKNKIELAFASAPKGERFGLLFNFVKYHSRWSELSEEDYSFERSETKDYLKGYVLLEETFADAKKSDVSQIREEASLAEKETKYLEKIINLAKEENIPLLLVKTPSNVLPDDQKLFNSVKKYAEISGIPYADFNLVYPEIGLVMNEDFYDKSHLNYKGAEKFSMYFGKYLKENMEISPTTPTPEWDEDLNKYRSYIKGLS